MVKNIKILLQFILALALMVLYITGCMPDVPGLFSAELSGDKDIGEEVSLIKSTSDGDVEDLDSRLNDLKEGLVSSPVILSHVSGQKIFGSGDKEVIYLYGLAEKGNEIEVYVNGLLEQVGIVVDENGKFETVSGIEIIKGKNIIELVALNSSGRKSSPTKFELFLSVPEKVEYAVYNNPADLEKIEGYYYDEESNPYVYIRGSYIAGSRMYIQANDRIVGEVTSDGNGLFTLEDVELKNGDNEIAVWAVTPDGYISAPIFNSITVFKDIITPYPSNLTGYKSGIANYISWEASIDDNFDAYKIIRVEDPCKNPEYPEDDVIATVTDQNATSYIDDDLEAGRSYYYTVWTLDKAGHAVSSNVLALPKPDYTISIKKLDSFTDYSVNRREWFYQYYEITNHGNVTLDLQPIILWIKLNPEHEEEWELSPLWEVHIWQPETGEYHYSNKNIYETYISDYWKVGGYTTTEEETTYSAEGTTKTVVVTETIQKTEETGLNLKRVMTTSTITTRTETDLTTGTTTMTTSEDTDTELVEPEKVGTLITGLTPNEKIKIGVKIQNISAADNEEIIVHFHFAPVDCDGHFYTDEEVSTLDIYCKSSDRNP
jgi:hypothetical protein